MRPGPLIDLATVMVWPSVCVNLTVPPLSQNEAPAAAALPDSEPSLKVSTLPLATAMAPPTPPFALLPVKVTLDRLAETFSPIFSALPLPPVCDRVRLLSDRL